MVTDDFQPRTHRQTCLCINLRWASHACGSAQDTQGKHPRQRCSGRSQQRFNNSHLRPLTNLLCIQHYIQRACTSPAAAFGTAFPSMWSWHFPTAQPAAQRHARLFNVTLWIQHLVFFLGARSGTRSWERPLWRAPSALCVAVNKFDGLLPERTESLSADTHIRLVHVRVHLRSSEADLLIPLTESLLGIILHVSSSFLLRCGKSQRITDQCCSLLKLCV